MPHKQMGQKRHDSLGLCVREGVLSLTPQPRWKRYLVYNYWADEDTLGESQATEELEAMPARTGPSGLRRVCYEHLFRTPCPLTPILSPLPLEVAARHSLHFR